MGNSTGCMGNCAGCGGEAGAEKPLSLVEQQKARALEPTRTLDDDCLDMAIELHSPANPASSSAKRGSKSRVSWSDVMEAGPLHVSVGEADEVTETGVLNVQFGILRQSNLYGCYQALPIGTTGADIVEPVPEGVMVEVRDSESSGLPSLSLWITFQSNTTGRCTGTFMAKLKGNVDEPDLTVNVCANVMGIDEGRPSSKREGVQLIQRKTPARFSVIDETIPVNEGMMMEKGKCLNHEASEEE